MNTLVKIYTSGLNHGLGIPDYETDGAAGMDIRANETVVLHPKETKLIKTGLYIAIPPGYEIQVRPRSGLSLKTPFRVANAPGTIDSDYRGEICVIGHNSSDSEDIQVAIGDRIAQLVLQQVPVIQWLRVPSLEELEETSRGTGGFGSTG